MTRNYTVYAENGLVKLSVDNQDDVLQFSSRNEINAFINLLMQSRDEQFPKPLTSPIIWEWDESKWGTNFNIEISTSRRFKIIHHDNDNLFTYSLYQLNKSYDPYAAERVQEYIKVGDDSTKVLNLKSIANLMNQESQGII